MSEIPRFTEAQAASLANAVDVPVFQLHDLDDVAAEFDVDLDEDQSVYVVSGPSGFTETFSGRVVDTLVRLGLIEHERDGHVMEDSRGNGIGPLHRFYRGVGK